RYDDPTGRPLHRYPRPVREHPVLRWGQVLTQRQLPYPGRGRTAVVQGHRGAPGQPPVPGQVQVPGQSGPGQVDHATVPVVRVYRAVPVSGELTASTVMYLCVRP